MDKSDLNDIKTRVKPFIRNDGERLFFYDPKDNIWIPNTRDGAARSLNKLLAAADTQLAASEAKAVINDILCDPEFERPLPAPPCDMINCKNGILALNELKLYERPKNPPDKNYFRICLDIDYNPNVHERDCKTFMNFLQNAFDIDLNTKSEKGLLAHPSVIRLLEMMGYMISNEYMAKKLLIILGPANSGKSQVLELIRRVIGYEHTVALTLDELSGQGGGRFRTELLTKAHALINDELPTKGLKHLAELKKIIAGEAITIEAKGATPKTVKVKTKMLFAGNQLPDLAEADCGNAFASRLCVVAFKKAPKESFRNVNLIDDLYKERDAIFSLAIKAFIELRKNSLVFRSDSAAESIVQAYKDDNASVITFINDEDVVTTGDGVSLTDLFRHYKDYCLKESLTPVKGIKAFRQQIVSWPHFSGFNKRRLGKNTNPCSVVEGIDLVRRNL